MKRQQVREALAVIMFVLFPVIFYYMSPYLVIMGASEGIIAGSLITFIALFISSLFLGRAYCGWVCPAGATQELCMKINRRNFKNGRANWIKYAIWLPWITIIVIMFLRAGGVTGIDPLYQTYYGVSITGVESVITFLIVAGIFAAIALATSKRGACHTICWMAPFMIIGQKISNRIKLPSLKLQSDKSKCSNCKLCTNNCPMSLDVNSMVQKGFIRNSECILCGTCVDNCPKKAISFQFKK